MVLIRDASRGLEHEVHRLRVSALFRSYNRAVWDLMGDRPARAKDSSTSRSDTSSPPRDARKRGPMLSMVATTIAGALRAGPGDIVFEGLPPPFESSISA